MYGEGKTIEDKKIADRVFSWNMKVLIQDVPFKPNEYEKDAMDSLRLRREGTYYRAVFYAGGDAFDKSQTPRNAEVKVAELNEQAA